MRNSQQNALLANILINPNTGLPYRGQRNNNLLNIRYNKGNNWQGQTGQDDSGYAQFDNRFSGIRAADKVLNNYSKLHNIDTIEGMVNRFAPKGDNNPVNAYIDNIYDKTGIERGSKINLQDPNVRNQLLPVMANFETPGANITLDDLQRARGFGKAQTIPSNNQGVIANPLFDPNNQGRINVDLSSNSIKPKISAKDMMRNDYYKNRAKYALGYKQRVQEQKQREKNLEIARRVNKKIDIEQNPYAIGSKRITREPQDQRILNILTNKPDINTSYNTGFMPGNATSTRKRQGQVEQTSKYREDLLGQEVSRTALQIMSANPDEVITSQAGNVSYQHLKNTPMNVKRVLAQQAIEAAAAKKAFDERPDAIPYAPYKDKLGDGTGSGTGSGIGSGIGSESDSFRSAGMYRNPAGQMNTNVEKPETERERLTRLIQQEYKPTSMNKNKYLLGILGGIMADRFGDPTVNNNNFGQFMDYAQSQNANNYEQYNDRRNSLLEQLKLLDDQSIDKQDSAGYYNPYGTGLMYGYYDGNNFVRVRDSEGQKAEYSADAIAGGMATPRFAPYTASTVAPDAVAQPASAVAPDATNNLLTEAKVVSVDPEKQKTNAQLLNNIESNYEFDDGLSDDDKERIKQENIDNLIGASPASAFVEQPDGSKNYWFNTDQPGQLETIKLPDGKTININSRATKKYYDTYGNDAPQIIASLLKQTDGLARELNTLDNILDIDPKILNKMSGPFRGESDNKLGKTLVGMSKALDYFSPSAVGGKRGVAEDINTAISYFDQFDGQVYAKAYEILKGAGQITEFEAKTVAKGLTNISRGLSGENLIEAIKEYKLINKIILDNSKARFGMKDENGRPYVEKDLEKALAELKGRN